MLPKLWEKSIKDERETMWRKREIWISVVIEIPTQHRRVLQIGSAQEKNRNCGNGVAEIVGERERERGEKKKSSMSIIFSQ